MFGRDKSKSAQPVPMDKGPLGTTAVTLSEKIITIGIDGKAGFDSAEAVAAKALREHRDPDKAIKEIISDHRKLVAANGFLTGLGGFVTMTVALPANILGFYLVATRMTAAIAVVRGYAVADPRLRTAILLTLVGADAADEVLKKAGIVSTGRLANLATKQLPPPALMVVNKAIGFRLAGTVGDKLAAKLGRAVPFAGGFIGAGVDVYLLHKIADNARQQFPLAHTLIQGR